MAVNTWDGASDTNWNDAANWNTTGVTDRVPTNADDVIIANVSNDPVIPDGLNPEVKTIELAASATLTCGNNTITVNDETSQYAFKGIGTLIPQTSTIVVTTDADTLIKCENGSFNNLTINPDGGDDTVTLYSAITVGGNLTITGGTLDTNSSSNYALTVTGDVSVAGTLTCNSSTVQCRGLDVSGSGTLTAPNASGSLTITGTQTGSSGNDAFDTEDGTTFTHSSGTITFTGNTNPQIRNRSGESFNNIVINTTGGTPIVETQRDIVIAGTLTIVEGTFRSYGTNARTITVTGAVSVENGGTLGGGSANTANHSFGSLTIASGGIYSATSGTTTIDGGGSCLDFTAGTLTHNNGLFKISGGNGTNIKTTGATANDNLYDLEIDSSESSAASTAWLGDGTVIEGNLTLTEGKFYPNTSSQDFIVKGNTSIKADATFGNMGSTQPTGDYTFGGVVTNSGGFFLSTGANNFNGGIRQLASVGTSNGTFNGDAETITIGGTGGILEGNLDDAIVNVNLDAALDFDGTNDIVDLNYGNGVNAQAGFSVSFWAKPDIIGGSSDSVMFVGAPSGTNQRFYIGINTGRWSFGYGLSGWDGSSGSITAFANVWHHVCLTTTSGAQKLYVNGVEITAQAKTDSSSFTLAGDLAAGAGAGGVYFADGKIADIKIFGDVLTAAEVQELSQKINYDISVGSIDNLTRWFKSNAGSGTTIADDSGNSGTAADISGATWIYDQYSVDVYDNSTTTDGTFTVTQGKVECLALSCLTLDGTGDYVTLASSVELEDYDWSISCWFRADEFSSNTLLGHSNGEHLIQFVNSTTLRSVFSDNGNQDITVSGLSTDKWHHLTYTRDDSTGVSKIYIDGVYNATGTFNSSANFVINRIGIEGNDEFDGEMRDIRIYDAMILSDDQVSSLYSGSFNVTPTHWWKCDEGTGQNPNDTGTGTAANGTGAGNADLITGNGTLDLDGDVTIAANGTLSAPRGLLTFAGGTFDNNGTDPTTSYIHNDGTFEFDSSGNAILRGGSSSTGTIFFNLLQDSGGHVDAYEYYKVINKLTVDSSRTWYINGSSHVKLGDTTRDINGELEINGVLHLSSSNTGTGTANSISGDNTNAGGAALIDINNGASSFANGAAKATEFKNLNFDGDFTTPTNSFIVKCMGDMEFDAVTVSSGDTLDLNGQRAEFSGDLVNGHIIDWDGMAVCHGAINFDNSANNNLNKDSGTIIMRNTSSKNITPVTGTIGGFHLLGSHPVALQGATDWGTTPVTVGSTTSTDLGNNLTCGNLTIPTAGVLNAGARTFTVAGDFTTSGGLLGASCLTLDGSQAGREVSETALVLNSHHTVECWVKPTSLTDTDQHFLYKHNSFRLGLDATTDKFSAWYRVSGAWQKATSTTAATANKWYHVAVSYNDTSKLASLYLDGKLEAETTLTGSPEDDNVLNIGDSHAAGDDRYFTGSIDEIRFWKETRAATGAAGIRAAMFTETISAGGTLDPNSKLFVQLSCNTGSGTDLNDTKDNMDDVDLNEAAWAGAGTFNATSASVNLSGTGTVRHADGTINLSASTGNLAGLYVSNSAVFNLNGYNLNFGSGATWEMGSSTTLSGTGSVAGNSSTIATTTIPSGIDAEVVGNASYLAMQSGSDLTVVGNVTGCTFADSTANIRQWHHTLDTQQLLDADEAGDDDLRLTKPALDNAHELMTG